ncbi:MAG: hypothetical protein AAF449_10510 [Myxococcota bacterium]
MKRPSLLLLWAARDVLRRPTDAVLVGLALAGLIWIAGTVALLVEAVRLTADRLIDAGPSLIVRKIGPAGFAPIAVTATSAVAGVPGALRVRARVWGPARADDRGVELVALENDAPAEGETWVGPGFAPELGALMTVRGPGGQLDLLIARALPESDGRVAQDSFFVRAQDARHVLGIPDGTATDIAVDVFRQSEEAAIRADIAAALPFVAAITTKTEARRRYATSLSRRGGLFWLALLPAALAIAALVAGAARDRTARGAEIGLLKAVGWTTADIVKLHSLRALWIALPAVSIGWTAAWYSVFSPLVRWPGTLLLGWSDRPPALGLDAGGAWVALVQVTVLAVAPWFVASIVPAIVSGARDPWSLLSGGPS